MFVQAGFSPRLCSTDGLAAIEMSERSERCVFFERALARVHVFTIRNSALEIPSDHCRKALDRFVGTYHIHDSSRIGDKLHLSMHHILSCHGLYER